MNRNPSFSSEAMTALRKWTTRALERQRVRLSITRWQQAKFVPVIVRPTRASRLILFHLLNPNYKKS